MQAKVIEVSIIVIGFFAFILVAGIMVKSARKEKKTMLEARRKELSGIIDNFMKCYDKFEKYLDKDMPKKQFIAELKREKLISSNCINIPMGKNGKQVPVNTIDGLRKFLFHSAELVLYNGDEFYRFYKIKIEDLDEYDGFMEKYEKLKDVYMKYQEEQKEA